MKTQLLRLKPYVPFLIVSVVLFFTCALYVNKVNFMQNDDWNRTTSVQRFLQGDFSLLPVTATTFYTQGLIGTSFAMLFGVSKLPYLTLIVSVLNFFVFSLILFKFIGLNRFNAVLGGLVLFFNPLHIYSGIGFMTENYTLFFLLLSLYFFLSFEKNNQPSRLALTNVMSILAFFCKQNGIILQASTVIYFLLRKKYKLAGIQLGVLVGILLFYYLAFPITPEMESKGFIFSNLTNLAYAYSLTYGIIILVVAITLPFIVIIASKLISLQIKTKNYLSLIVFGAVTVLSFFILNKYYKPGSISWEEFPSLKTHLKEQVFFPDPCTVPNTSLDLIMIYTSIGI